MDAKSETIVIQWTSEGGLEQPISTLADLTVFADGRVMVGPRFTDGKVVEEQLSKSDFNALCNFVFQEKDIWSIDSAALDQEVKAAASLGADVRSEANTIIQLEMEAIADAATTVIRTRLGEREHLVKHYNLLAHAQRYPEIDSLQRLRAIELRLLALAKQVANAAR
ncbi:MAG: hypothetical protein DHS20C01_38550 [marine bacterium B5-7]|nr:MAG: hypothetical protein DHS20C01_38550 [marine bacterium B5-7]